MEEDCNVLDPTRRFSSRVDYYVRSRPRYPQALLDFCRDELGMGPGKTIADIGSGTGFLSELFLGAGYEVFGVEPNDAMRHAAEKLLAGFANFHSVNARAEATSLDSGSVDFIVAGQAFHWFDRPKTRVEFRRVLRPGGWVMLVWNDRQKTQTPGDFSSEYDSVIKEFQTDLKRVSHADLTSRESTALNEFFAPNAVQTRSFDNPQTLDAEGVIARALSSSYLPLPGEARCQEMIERLHRIVDRCGENGKVVQPYTTKVYYGRLN
jgi:SAM-dependent methyltransferase